MKIATEVPAWRKKNKGGSGMGTSEMLVAVEEYVKRYYDLPAEVRCQAMPRQAMAEFLYQVNNIEGEGFDTFRETEEAWEALQTGQRSHGEDERLDAVYSLHAALAHCFDQVELQLPNIVDAHHLLLRYSDPRIAGRIRTSEDDVVHCETSRGYHVFTWPTEVPFALDALVSDTNSALERVMQQEEDVHGMVEGLLQLATLFFFRFECIHPFVDGNGRMGRVLLASLLRKIMPFPSVLFVDVWAKSKAFAARHPPFVPHRWYYECFLRAQAEADGNQKEISKRRADLCRFHPPEDLLALVIEGVYVGWKRFFKGLEEHSRNRS